VREPAGQHATALLVAPVNTWQAYNPWGGKSLYDFQSTNNVPAVKVSFNRPFHPAHTSLEYDLDVVRWLEREGYDVSYTTDVDVSLDPSSLLAHTLVMTAGHDEYWTKEQRDAFEAARNAGVNLAFMSGNTAYWQARLEDGGRTLVEYRDAQADPVTDPSLDTVQFRQLVPPRPECTLLGVEYNGGQISGIPNYDLPVNPSALGNPWFANTGFTSSSVVQQAVGYEWDQIISGCNPPGAKLTTYFHYDGAHPSDVVSYTAPSGAIVFSAGTLGFDTALDNYSDGVVDTRLQQFMRNAMADLMVSHVAGPSAPVNLSPPTVSGSPLVGQTLTATTGSWTGSPTSYAYAWRRCDTSGASCATIGGASSSTYVLQAADAGSTIRVRVTATNGIGPSAPADSSPTADVLMPGGGGTFGATAPGGSSGSPGAGYKFGGAYQLATAGTANRFDFYARGGAAAQSFIAAIYSSSGGAPANLLVSSSPVTVAANQTAGWVSATLPSTQLAAGTYYLVLLSQTTASSAFIYYDAAQGQDGVFNENSGSTPSATFGTFSTEARDWSYRVQLAGAPPPPPPVNTAPPVVSGTTQQGQTLTTTNGTWTNGPTSYAIKWQRCDTEDACFDINGATSSTYVLQAGDVGDTLRSVVTASNAGGPGTPAPSAETAVVTGIPVPVNTAPPVVSGTAQQGQQLSSTNGTWTNSPSSFALKWQRCDAQDVCTDINGATSSTYVLQAADVGDTIRSVVTASNAGGPGAPAASAETAVVTGIPVPVNTAPPVVSGTAQQGQTLTTTNGTWTNSPTSYSYQWRRCDSAGANCANITGATSSSYVLQAGDVGSTLVARVTAANAGGPGSPADSAATAVVTAFAVPVNTAPPVVSGTAQQGQTLSTTNGTWTNNPNSYTYQWRRCDSAGANCADIGTATSSTYVLQAADVGSTLVARVTAANAGGPGSPADSNPTAVVTGIPVPVNTAVPVVSGTAQQNQQLSTGNGTWTNSPTSYSYQWRRCDSAGANCANIAGATSSTYVLVAADVGATIRARVTASNAGGPGSPADSAATAVVTSAPAPTTFGAANPGASSSSPASGYKFGTPYSLGSASVATRFDFYARGGSSAQSFTPAIYASNGSSPTTLVATGATVSVTANKAAGWVSSTLPSTNLAAGTYYLVLLSGTTSNGAFIYWDAGAASDGVYNTNAGSTPSATFGSFSTEARKYSYRVAVTPSGPPPPPPVNTAVPVITGTAQQGQQLSTGNGTWTNSPTSFSYQWRRCDGGGASCSDIGGATGSTYLLVAADVGATIRARVTASNAGGPGTPADSAATAVVTAAPPPSTFGAVNPGASSSSPASGYKFGTPYTLSSGGTATRFDFYARGGTSAQSFTPAIYASNGTGPTTLIATGATVSVAANRAAGWISSTLPATSLPAGTYYLVLLSGTTSKVAFIYWDTGAATDGVFNTNTGSTPSNPFGTFSTEARKYSYRVAVS
jgi:hypothetical protein